MLEPARDRGEFVGPAAQLLADVVDQLAEPAGLADTRDRTSRDTGFFVERRIYEEFTHKVAEFSRTLKVGDGIDPETRVGPLVSSEQMERVSGYLSLGAQEGARALSGGARLTEVELELELTRFGGQ